MYKAVFTDMDGTLLRNDHSISEATRAMLQKLVAAGIPVVLVSARPIHGILPISRWLGLQNMPIVSLNGGYIGLEEKIIYESAIEPQTIAEIQQIARGFSVTLIYYAGMEWFSESDDAATAKEQRITDVPIRIAPFAELATYWKAHGSGINKIMAVGEPGVVNVLENKLHGMYGNRMNVYTSKPTYLEIMQQGASKTNAVKFLINRYQLRPDEIIAVGDNFNDKDMIAFAGRGIAMGNAPAEVKAVASYVTDTNQQDGVRKALEKFIAV